MGGLRLEARLRHGPHGYPFIVEKGNEVLPREVTGEAVSIHGRWLVTRQTFCSVMNRLAITPPGLADVGCSEV